MPFIIQLKRGKCIYTPLPKPYFTSFFRFTVEISLSGDGKALSFFLSESVQHKDTQFFFIFWNILQIHWVNSVVSDRHMTWGNFGKLISQGIFSGLLWEHYWIHIVTINRPTQAYRVAEGPLLRHCWLMGLKMRIKPGWKGRSWVQCQAWSY